MNNQLNPDPQGGESNMTDEQVVRQVYPAVATEVEYLGHDYDNGNAGWSATLTVQVGFADGAHENTAISNAWADARAKLPEGATTQPTPASEIEFHAECRYPDCQCERVADPKADFGFRLNCTAPPLPPTRVCTQPVPSAGSKPQEEGRPAEGYADYGLPYTVKCPECYAEPGEACYLRLPGTTWRQWPHILRGEHAVKIAKSQPVADGGGLVEGSTDDALMASVRGFANGDKEGCATRENIRALVNAHASSREALRVARERMQQAVAKLKDVQGRDGFDNKQLAEAINLLSPEGSSR